MTKSSRAPLKEIPASKAYRLLESGPVVLVTEVSAPLIRECIANLECKVSDTRLVKAYSFFVREVVRI